jgi:hypothetical protein
VSRSKGPKVVVTVRPGAAPAAESVQLKIRVSPDVARKLRLESFGRDCSLGRVVEDWSRLVPTRFYLADRSKGPDGPSARSGPSVPGPSLVRGDDGPVGPESAVA